MSDLLLLDETLNIMEGFFRVIMEGSYRVENNERIFRHKGSFEEEDQQPKTEIGMIDEEKDIF